MLKKIKIIVMILIMFFIVTFITNVSQARVTSTDVTVESGGTASITISTSTPVRSFKIELISAEGLTFQSASKSSSFPAGASNGSTINGVSQGSAATTLATYTFKVPEVTTSQSYTVQFRVTGMDEEDDTTNTATVTVNPKQAEPEPTPEPEPEPTPELTPEPTPDPTPTEPTYTVTEASGTFYITTSGVNLRKGPGTNYDSVGSAPKDTAVTRTGVSGKWTRISYNGQNVFISSQYLTSTKPVEEEPEQNENENTIANEVANTTANETANEVANEITNTVADDEQSVDENSELQLKTLEIEGVDTSKIFKPGIYEYNINVSKDVKQLQITAVANQEDASVEILGNEDFVEGENIVTIMLKSADGEETATYQLIVNVGAVTAEEGFPFIAVLGIIVGIIVVAIIVLVVLIIRNRRNAQWDENEEDWEEPEELNTTYDTPDFTNQEDNEGEESSTRNRRGKHF